MTQNATLKQNAFTQKTFKQSSKAITMSNCSMHGSRCIASHCSKEHMVNCVSSAALVPVCVLTRIHQRSETNVFWFCLLLQTGIALKQFFFFRLHFFGCECVFCFFLLQDTMADAKGTDSRTKELLEPATLFVQYRVRNVVKKSLQLPALFSHIPFTLFCTLHDVFAIYTTVHKRGRLRDQTAREMLTSEQSYAATLEEMVSVCDTNQAN